MLCEVETAIQNLGLKMPLTHKSALVTESSNWAREGDLTHMLIQDSGVLRLYQAFLNDWIRALRNATATGPGTCDPTMLRPLTSYFKQKKQHNKPSKSGVKKKKKKQPGRKPNGKPKARLVEARKQQQRQVDRLLAQNAKRMAKKKMMRKKQQLQKQRRKIF